MGGAVIMMTSFQFAESHGRVRGTGVSQKTGAALFERLPAESRTFYELYKLSDPDKRARLCKYVPFYKILKCTGLKKTYLGLLK